jgi:hypothetical protein
MTSYAKTKRLRFIFVLMEEAERLRADVSALVVELSGWMHHAEVLVKQLGTSLEAVSWQRLIPLLTV